MTYQGIAQMHKPNWFPEDREKLEKVLLELWPNSKINPRKMYYYVDNVKGFYPEIVQEAISNIVATQEYDRRPTINQIRKVCQQLIRGKHFDRNPGSGESVNECGWCTGLQLVFVGLYVEDPERCVALDIQGKNVLKLADGWAVRPDWGKELELPLKEYMAFCPHCAPSKLLEGSGSALAWSKRFGVFTEFRCRQNGNTDRQWQRAFTLYNRMISSMRPKDEGYDGFKREEARFHEYLDGLPKLREFEERKMNVVTPREEPGRGRMQTRKEGDEKPASTKG